MAYTGKATYSAGTNLPELAEDISDIIGIVSPYETPLLDAIGDPLRETMSPHHEWLEDSLLPNKDIIDHALFGDPENDTEFGVENADRFRVGDQIQVEGLTELMMVTGISGSNITVIRGYAGTTREVLENNMVINILGNAALEGSEKPAARFTNRTRNGNYTQIFTAGVEVSGTDMASSQLGLADEMDYQKQERLRELLRDLENTVINGGQPSVNPQGSQTVRRSMKGIMQHLSTNVFEAGGAGFPTGADLTEEMVNFTLRKIWENSNGNIDLIVVGGAQKRKINGFVSSSRTFASDDTTYTNMINVYESDFGICRVVTTRWMPQDAVLFLDSSRVNVLPLAGRNFHFKPLASTGDYESGELIGEYTLELKNQEAHGLVRNLSTT